VAGRDERANGLGQAAAAFAQALGWPLLADPLSGARRGAAAVAHYDALLRDADFVGAHVPDLILRVGDLPPSKPLRVWLSGLSAVRQVALDPEGAWQDPSCVLWGSLEAEPASTLARLAESPPSPAPQEWLSSWRAADGHAAGAISRELEGAGLSEPAVAAELARLLPPHAILFVASSMPVRDVETFWPVLADPPRVLCNRAANGIDGTVASALGAAAGSEGPVVLLIGDVAIAHDVGSLLAARRLSAHLTVVCLNNEGGGIFDFLDVAGADIARQPDIYSEHIATPPGLDLAAAAQLAGAAYEQPLDVAALRAAITRALASAGGLRLIEVRTQRPENVALHRRLWAAVATAVASPRPVLSRPIPRT
jgi:2-succinyl-5-enolpyruvyl-6-hydroxy-3-cyclohexene-1-carboxylate synthase